MNLQRLLRGKCPLLPDTACVLVFKAVSIHYIKNLSSVKGKPSNLGAQGIQNRVTIFYFFSFSSQSVLPTGFSSVLCVHIYSFFTHLITAENQQGFSHTLIKQLILLAVHTLSLYLPLLSRAGESHMGYSQNSRVPLSQPYSLCLLTYERLLITPSSQDRLPPSQGHHKP